MALISCSRCNNELPINDFYSQNLSWCKKCRIEYQRNKRKLVRGVKGIATPYSVLEKQKTKWNTPSSYDIRSYGGSIHGEFSADLAEFCIKMWSNEADTVLDPFAGYLTRGFVSRKLNRNYIGFEVSKRTYDWSKPYLDELDAKLVNDDGCSLNCITNDAVDMIFTCPPYHNLEKYEKVPGQLSEIEDYTDFLTKIGEMLDNANRVLKKDKFAVFVVGDWRANDVFYAFHNDFINLATNHGFVLWDIAIHKNKSRYTNMNKHKFKAMRYTGRIHEYILVFKVIK